MTFYQIKKVLKAHLNIFLLALLIRLLLMPFLFHPDLKTQFFHAQFLGQGVFNIYQYIQDNKDNLGYKDTFNYPPLTYFLLGSWSIVSHPFLGNAFDNWLNDWSSDWFTNSQIFRELFVLKLPYLVFDFLMAFLLVSLIDKKYSQRVLVLWLLNPVTLYIIYGLSNFDLIPTFFTLLSLFLFKQKKDVLGGLSLGIGVATKFFPLLFFPFFALAYLRYKNWAGLIKFCLACFGVFGITILPFIKNIVSLQSNGLTTLFLHEKLTLVPTISIPVFLILFIGILILSFKQKPDWSNINWGIIITNLAMLSVTRFHPQWLLWVIPFLIISIVDNLNILFAFVPIVFGFILSVILFSDRFLTVGVVSPIFPQIYDVGFFETTFFSIFSNNLVILVMHISLYTGSLLIFILLSRRLWIKKLV